MKTYDYITEIEEKLNEPLRVKAWRERLGKMTLRRELTDELRSATKRLADVYIENARLDTSLEGFQIEIMFAIIQVSDIQHRIAVADVIAAVIQENTTED